MAITEIPTSFRYVCDGCGVVAEMASKSRPKHWSDLHILRDAYDYQGAAVADGSIKRLLCGKCADAATGAINTAITAVRAAAAKAREEGK